MFKKGRTFINLLIDTIILHLSHICVERGLQTAFKLSRYWPTIELFLIESLLKIHEIHVDWHFFTD